MPPNSASANGRWLLHAPLASGVQRPHVRLQLVMLATVALLLAPPSWMQVGTRRRPSRALMRHDGGGLAGLPRSPTACTLALLHQAGTNKV
eukprot:3983926-Prymnesium_polylepis.1